MAIKKQPESKHRLHPRNKNREAYDLKALKIAIPELSNHIKLNTHDQESIDFSNPLAVKLLNKALLKHYYNIENWNFPDKNLCPPIPGRADYIHHIADVLAESNYGKIPIGNKITILDIGIGANCIYPIIGVTEYDWTFIGSDIDEKSIASAKQIISSNTILKDKITCVLQKNQKDIFYGVLNENSKIEVSLCNPPFHASREAAENGTLRKIKNLTGKAEKTPTLNFSGVSNELICPGGESWFIQKMVKESKRYAKNCFWFSTLVSKQSNLKAIYKSLKEANTEKIKTISMGTGNKSSRVVAWTFLTPEEQKVWKDTHWKTTL